MGRPQSFDTPDALRRAAAVFARRGYEGASISHLVEATGLKRGSLYGAFGSKAELFRESFGAAVGAAESPDLVTDLLVVALRERAAYDPVVAATTERAIAWLASSSSAPISELVFTRLLAVARPATGGEEERTP
ncbi:helix-turn-helix domain-containing protein [Micromonospora sp. NPDC047074]|uniref:helix-turn-helix domain-containing protein n=1 Tax=Micromonospora sp. NPDC047074 TaxID=3154339 RepID=UPI0033D8AD95